MNNGFLKYLSEVRARQVLHLPVCSNYAASSDFAKDSHAQKFASGLNNPSKIQEYLDLLESYFID